MKKLSFRAMIAPVLCLALFAAASCSSDDDAPTPTITPSKTSVTIPASGEAQTVTVATNQTEWTASRPEADTWCILNQADGKLSISASENTTLTPRTTTVTLSTGGGKGQRLDQRHTVGVRAFHLGRA